MQESVWFENQIIKPSNLDFMNTSTAKNVTDAITAFTKGQPGAVAGLIVDPALSLNTATATVTAGYGFLANGERVQLFSPSGVSTLPFSGTTSIYASLVEVNYNPDPSLNPLGNRNVVSGLNAGSLNYQAVEEYNLLNLTTISGAAYIKLADVVTNFGVIQSIDYSNRQNLKVGQIDLFANTINGAIIVPSSIDSNQFVSPLHYDIALNSGVSINYLGSGINHIASSGNPIGSIFAVSGTFHDISGFSPILVDSLTQKSGTSLESNSSYVTVDTANKGTQLGGGMIVSGNSIDLSGIINPANANFGIKVNPAADINVNAKNLNIGAVVNIGAGGINVAGGNINVTAGGQLNVPSFTVTTLGINGAVSGTNTVFQGSVGISGNIISSGNLIFGHTDQQFNNILPNGLLYPSGTNFSGTNIPNIWSGTNPSANFIIGPLNSPFTAKPYLTLPVGSGTLGGFLQGKNQYTVEMVFKSAGAGFSRYLAMNNANTWRLESNNISGHMKTFYLMGNTGALILETPQNTWNANTWTHLALTSSGSATTIWVDGVAKVTNLSSVNNAFPASITAGTIASWSTDTVGVDDLFLKAIKFSNKAKSVFPSGLTNLYQDADTVALYDFNVVPSGVNRVPASGLGNLVTATAPMTFYEAPSGTYTVGSAFLGQSFSGSTVLDYTKDTMPVGSSNVFSGVSNSPYFFQISGNNISPGLGSGVSPSGILFSTPLSVTEGISYKISYFTKLISGSIYPFVGSDSNAIGVRAYAFSPTTQFTSTIFSGSNLVGDWTRNSFDFVSPSGSGPLNLYLNFYGASGNTVSGASLIGMSSIQATRGAAQLETIVTGPGVISLIHDSLNTTLFSSQTLGQSNVYVYYSGTIFSQGGMATITPQLNHVASKWFNGDSQGYWLIPTYDNAMSLNGTEIIRENFKFQGVQSSNPTWPLRTTRSWTGYLNKGPNLLVGRLSLTYGGDTATCRWLADVSNVPKTDIVMH